MGDLCRRYDLCAGKSFYAAVVVGFVPGEPCFRHAFLASQHPDWAISVTLSASAALPLPRLSRAACSRSLRLQSLGEVPACVPAAQGTVVSDGDWWAKWPKSGIASREKLFSRAIDMMLLLPFGVSFQVSFRPAAAAQKSGNVFPWRWVAGSASMFGVLFQRQRPQ